MAICRLCPEVKNAHWRLDTVCACTDSMNVCTAHLGKGIKRLSARDDSHSNRETVAVTPIKKR